MPQTLRCVHYMDTGTVAGQTSGETWIAGAEGANPKGGESLRQKDRGI